MLPVGGCLFCCRLYLSVQKPVVAGSTIRYIGLKDDDGDHETTGKTVVLKAEDGD